MADAAPLDRHPTTSPARRGPAWLAANWDAAAVPSRPAGRLASAPTAPGWPRWSRRAGPRRAGRPEWFGRGLSDAQARIVEREFARVGAPGTGQDRTNLWANTAARHGDRGAEGQADRARSC